ncbi:MAG: response regulator [Tepidisphaeraceae bacterium]|jgi:response regulator NasT
MHKLIEEPRPVAEATYRCLVVEDETLVAMGLKAQLERMGHSVVAQAADAEQAEAFFRKSLPDLVLTDIRLNNHCDGLELAERLLRIRPCPIVVISAYGEKALIERATGAGVFGYLIKPVSDEALAAQIEVAVARCREHSVLVAEKQALTTSLENRKLIDRAKGILMQRANLTEAEAHKRLQQESQKRRISAPELAKKIIESEELLGC